MFYNASMFVEQCSNENNINLFLYVLPAPAALFFCLPKPNRDVMKFAFKFDDIRTLNVFSKFEDRQIFSSPVVKFETQVYMIGAVCLHID